MSVKVKVKIRLCIVGADPVIQIVLSLWVRFCQMPDRSTDILRFSEGCNKGISFLVNRSASFLLEEYVPGFWVPRVQKARIPAFAMLHPHDPCPALFGSLTLIHLVGACVLEGCVLSNIPKVQV